MFKCIAHVGRHHCTTVTSVPDATVPMAGGLAALFAADKLAAVATEIGPTSAVSPPPATLGEVLDALRATRDASTVLRGTYVVAACRFVHTRSGT